MGAFKKALFGGIVMQKKLCVSLLLIILIVGFNIVPVSAKTGKTFMIPQNLIDCPTAGIAKKDTLYFHLRMFEEGGVLTKISTGIYKNFTAGLSFSNMGLIGSDDVESRIGIQLKWMAFQETIERPALTVGLDTQGYGPFYTGPNRYRFKSKGLYVVASKNFMIQPKINLSNLGVHVGINHSFESDDESNVINVFFGMDKVILEPTWEFILEYDLALNDDKEDGIFGEPKNQGYVNLGLRWSPLSSLNLEFILKNVNENNDDMLRVFTLTFRTDSKLRIE
jgi:hypothetical protein